MTDIYFFTDLENVPISHRTAISKYLILFGRTYDGKAALRRIWADFEAPSEGSTKVRENGGVPLENRWKMIPTCFLDT